MPPSEQIVRMDDFNESDHPRASDGKFGSGGGSAGNGGKPDLTSKESKAISEYGQGNAYNVNKYLKDPKAGKAEAKANFGARAAEYTKSIESDAKTIDGIISKATLSEDTKLFRGVSDFAHLRDAVSDLKPGDTFSLPTFSSTSRSEKWAKGFMEGKSGDKGLIVIDAKAGANGLNMDAHARHKGDEQEVLLGRNAPFKFERYDAKTNTIHVTLEPSPTGARNDAAPTGASYRIEGQQMIKAAGIMLLTTGKQVLYLKRGDGGDFPGHWCFPGGRQEDGETAEQAAIRETEEEAGYKAEGLKFWTRRIAQHETTGAQISPQDGIPVAETVSPVVLPPGDTLVVPGVPVDFTTFACAIAEPFTPTLNDENVGYAWAPVDQPPEPLHPGCRIALARLTMDELGIARAIAAGELTSPQRYVNVSLYAMRITGTGAAYRSKDKEYVWRDPQIYLNDEFLARCNGLPVIFVHPKGRVLNSKEFSDRAVGTIMLPYIRGDEVWGIAKIYDADTIGILENVQYSTSPGVVLGEPEDNTKVQLADGSRLLIEGDPKLLDHLAICEQGVWDKGGEPAGIESNNIGDVTMTEEELKAKADAEAKEKADAEAKAKADAEGGTNKILEAIAALTGKVDSVSARVDSMEKAKADAEESAEDKERREKAEKEKADKEKADAEEKEKTEREEKAKADAEELKSKVDAALGSLPKNDTDADYPAMADAQEKCDSVASAFGQRAPAPLAGESVSAYRKRLVSKFKAHSPAWKDIDLAAVNDSILPVAEATIYADAMKAANSPIGIPDDVLHERVRNDEAGRPIRTFIGKPSAWMNDFKIPTQVMRLRSASDIRKDA